MKTFLQVGLVVVSVFTSVSAAGCAGEMKQLSNAEKAEIEEHVSAMALTIASDLEARGPIAWLDHFLDVPEFFMASDGRLLFPDIESAEKIVEGFAHSIAKMELVWRDIFIDPIEDGMAMMGATYDEVLVDTSGTVLNLSGYFTGMAVETADGWKLRNLHWSSPLVPDQVE